MSTLDSPERPVGVPERSAPDPHPWNALWALPIALIAVVVGGIVLVIATEVRDAVVDPAVHRDGLFGVAAHGPPPALTLVATLAQDLVLVIGAMIAAASALNGRITLAHFGLRPTRPGRAAAYVAGAYVLFVLFAAAWTTLMGVDERENIAVDLGTRDSAFAFAGAAFLVCVVAPIAEELFFRGYLFGALRRRGLAVAALVSGTAFGLAHLGGSPLGFIVPLATLGIVLALLYERTGSLYPPIALHAINNSIAFGVGDGRAWVIPACLAGCALSVAALTRLRMPGARVDPAGATP